MKLLLKILFVFLLSQHNIAQISPIISYKTPNTFTIGESISPLKPTHTGGIVSGAEVTTVAGSGSVGSNNGTGSTASFNDPRGMAFDILGNLYVADAANHKIRKVTPKGVVTTFAGSGIKGATNGLETTASFSSPNAITTDVVGNFYVADMGNQKIRKITPNGEVTTFAGSGTEGAVDGPAHLASFNHPHGSIFDSLGNLYVVDYANHKIRKITPDGVVTTFVGGDESGANNGQGHKASFASPRGITIDASDNVYVADSGNHMIRKITPRGMVTTFAGSGSQDDTDGVGTSASFNSPIGVAIDKTGNLIIADKDNNKVRQITPEGIVTTIAGSGERSSLDGPGATATFYGISKVAVNNANEIYVSTLGHKIRKITYRNGSYSISPDLPTGMIFNTETGIITGTPTTLLPASTYTITAINESGHHAFNISITVNDIIPEIRYTASVTLNENEAMAPLIPTSTGGQVTNYTISPDLPSGLTFDSTTGIISGIPNNPMAVKTYTITASNSGGTATFDMDITIKGLDILVSEVITPNGDRINDTWIIKNIENYSNAVIQVFNRWGTKVFTAKNYQNDWNGYYKNNSRPLPESGSYYYQIDLEGDGIYKKHGWIYITR